MSTTLNSKLNYKDTKPPRDLSSNDLVFLKRWNGESKTEEELKQHVFNVHAEVISQIHVYRCISILSYLSPKASTYPIYNDVITQAKLLGPEMKILDIGTCFGQEARGLIVDGLLPECVHVTDLHDFYWNAGIRLFDESNSTFSVSKVNTFFGNLATPFTTPTVSNANDIVSGKKDMFHAVLCMAILHVLTYEESIHMLTRIHYILKSDGVVFGHCVGSSIACQWGRTPTESGQRWLHDRNTLESILQSCGFREISVTQKEHRSVTALEEEDGIEKVILVFVARK